MDSLNAAPPVGATSYVFRYLLGDPAGAPAMDRLLQMARAAGLDRLQVCENARPLELSPAEWAGLRRFAEGIGLTLTLGCMTLDPAVVAEYLGRVEAIGGTTLRIVLERAGAERLTVERIRAFLDEVLPGCESRGVRLAIENHFDIPSRILAEAVHPYPARTVGFCVDVANSLRNFEDSETVLDLLGGRAYCYHFKDYTVSGSSVGFSVSGAPFGEGRIDARKLLRRVFEHAAAPEIYLETWTPSTGVREADTAADLRWLEISVRNWKAILREGKRS